MALVPGQMGIACYYRGLGRTPGALATLAELACLAAALAPNWAILGTAVVPGQVVGTAVLWAAAAALGWQPTLGARRQALAAPAAA